MIRTFVLEFLLLTLSRYMLAGEFNTISANFLYTPRKHQKIKGFLIISGGIVIVKWVKATIFFSWIQLTH